MSEEPTVYGMPIEDQPPNPWAPLLPDEGEFLSRATLQERVDFAVRELGRAEILMRAERLPAEPQSSTQPGFSMNWLPASRRVSRAVSALKIKECPRQSR